MRNTTFFTMLLAGTLAWSVNSQQAPQGSGAVQPNQGLPPGLQNREQLPPGLQNREQLPPGLQNRTAASVTNQVGRFGTNLNRFGTNLYGSVTNQLNQYGMTNRFSSTNSNSLTNESSAAMQDRALTPTDQRLLVQIRQAIRPMTTPGRAWAPVYFIANRGVVTVAGQLPDAQQKQQLVTVLRRIPGVLRIVDNIEINVPSGSTLGSAPPQAQSGSGVAQTTTITQDQAASVADRNLVIQLRQGIRPIIGSSEPWSPVHFISREGVVTLVGFVPNEPQRQQLVEIVQQTPGVVRVIDQLQVNAQVNTPVGAGGWLAQTNVSGVNTNLTPTGRTNNANQGLPPGLQNREQLPLGLQRRDQLPPGLEKRQGSDQTGS